MARKDDPESSSLSLISQETEIQGDIISNGNIRIDGSLTGTLKAKGKVVIGPSSKIKGDIQCETSEVSGTIDGDIVVSQLLSLKSTSKLFGNIETSKLTIEPGAVLTGTCKMTDLNNTDGGDRATAEE
ncbi:MAG: polymer-forming cytoskeletal protein [Bacteroidales bacterium]|nr:polymer-forming cytoskeletal protein [Bacteroidales bacterium]